MIARWLAACFVLALALPALADEPRRVVLVVTAGADEARAKSVMEAIRAQLGDLPVAVVVKDPGEAPKELRDRLDFAARVCKENHAVGAFFIELERPDDLLLYLVEPEAQRALVRRVKKSAGAEEAGAEELSLIVRSTTGALLEGREIGMEEGPELAPKPKPAPKPPPPKPLPPKPPAPKPAAPKPPPASASVGRLRAHYAGQAYAPEAPWQSGLGVDLSASPDGRLFFGLGYVAFAPIDVEGTSAHVRVARYPLRLFAAYEVPIDRFRFGVELGLVGELARRSTTQTSSGVAPTGNADRLFFGVSPRVTASYEVWPRARVGAGVGLDVFFNDSVYVADLPGRQETLLSPYRTRASADIGLAVDLW